MRAFTELASLLLLMSTLVPPGQPLPTQPSDYTPAAPANVVTWQLKRLPPPSALYVTRDDVLRVVVATSQANEVVTITYRLLRAADGKVVPGSFDITVPVYTFPVTPATKALAEGFLLSVSAQAKQATTRGQTFVRVSLAPSALGTAVAAQLLMADYVTTAQAPAFPGGRITSPTEGPGWVYAAQQTNPARGHDWGETTSLNARRRLIAANALLATSATAGNRIPQLVVLDNLLNFVMVFTSTTTQAPSVTDRYVWSAAPIIQTPITTGLQVPLPDNLILPLGYSVEVVTQALDTNAATGDLWSSIFLYWEEWLDNV